MKELVTLEEEILEHKGQMLPDDLLIQAKKDGFADKYPGQILDAGIRHPGSGAWPWPGRGL
ncbi:MAG: hypothetical protein R2860_05775 [Desulfobacterales bacterium]